MTAGDDRACASAGSASSCVALVVVALIGVQYARIIGRNVALAHELRDVQRDVAQLSAKRAQQVRDIRRLSDPRGAIPEIHDRLHLVGDKEAIIYLKREARAVSDRVRGSVINVHNLGGDGPARGRPARRRRRSAT